MGDQIGGLCVAVRSVGEAVPPERAKGGSRLVPPTKDDAAGIELAIGAKVVPESELTLRRGGLVLTKVGVDVADDAPEPATGGRLVALPAGNGDTVEDGLERSILRP